MAVQVTLHRLRIDVLGQLVAAAHFPAHRAVLVATSLMLAVHHEMAVEDGDLNGKGRSDLVRAAKKSQGMDIHQSHSA